MGLESSRCLNSLYGARIYPNTLLLLRVVYRWGIFSFGKLKGDFNNSRLLLLLLLNFFVHSYIILFFFKENNFHYIDMLEYPRNILVCSCHRLILSFFRGWMCVRVKLHTHRAALQPIEFQKWKNDWSLSLSLSLSDAASFLSQHIRAGPQKKTTKILL